MKVIIVLSAILAIAAARPTVLAEKELKEAKEEQVQIIHSDFETFPDGSYSFSYENSDGSARTEKATVLNPGEENEMISIVGSYKYKNENGQLVEVSYVSDDRGFIPTGTIIHPAIIKNAELVSHNVDEEEEEEMHSDAMHHEMHHHETMHHDKH